MLRNVVKEAKEPQMTEVREVESADIGFDMSWLIISKTMNGYAVYQEHPRFTHDDRIPRPLAVFETKKALVEWMAGKWMPKNPEHEFKCA
jgi:hypothetical protein